MFDSDKAQRKKEIQAVPEAMLGPKAFFHESTSGFELLSSK